MDRVATAGRGSATKCLGRVGRFLTLHSAQMSWLGVGSVAAVARISTYEAPLDRDTGQMLYGGGVVMHGGVPYVDAGLNKGPATYVLFALIRLITGGSVVAVRLTLLAAAVAAAVAIGVYVRGVAGEAAGGLAALTFAMLAACGPFQGDDPNLEQYAVAPMAGALLLSSRPSLRAATVAGAMTAFSGLMSPAFVIPLAPAVLLALWRDRADYGRRVGAAAAGAIVVVAVAGVWLATGGALDDFAVQVPGTSEAATASPGPLFGLHRLLTVPAGGLWLAALAGCLIALRLRRFRLPAVIALSWIVLCWARVKFGDYFIGDPEYPHHWYPALPGLVIGLSLGIVSVWPAEPGRQLATAALVLTSLMASYVFGPQYSARLLPPNQRGLAGITSASELAKFIDAHTGPSDTVFVRGSYPEIYWLADRAAPTRFFDEFPVIAHPSYASEREQALRRWPPQAVVAVSGDQVDPYLQALLDKSDMHSHSLLERVVSGSGARIDRLRRDRQDATRGAAPLVRVQGIRPVSPRIFATQL